MLGDLVTSFCGSLTPNQQLDDVGGPRFRLLQDDCNDRFGIPSLDTGGSRIANCLLQETNCAAEKLLLVQMPRARDLLASANVTIGNAATSPKSCLTLENGSGAIPTAKAGKALVGCQTRVVTAGAKFVVKARAALEKCADAVMTCAQLTRTQKCVDAATKTCTKQIAAVDTAQVKVHDAVAKGCTKLPLADLLDANGGDVGALETVCQGVGVAPLATLADYADCVAQHARCQVEDSIRFTAPRIAEFFTATQQPQPFGSAFCSAP